MADEKVETTKVPEVEPQKEPEKVEVKKDETKVKSIEELIVENETLKHTVTNKEQEAERVHKKLQKFEDEEKQRDDAKLSEIEKVTKRAETAEKEAAESKQKLLRREIAAKVGIDLKFEFPEILISRIQGGTPEEMEADAKKLIEELPKSKINLNPTNPGGGLGDKETDEQIKKRIFGSQN